MNNTFKLSIVITVPHGFDTSLIRIKSVNIEDDDENGSGNSFAQVKIEAGDGEKNELIKYKMLNYLETQRPYLRPEFIFADLAFALKIPMHQCSFVLNHLIGKNFRDWINGYRIEHFVQNYTNNSKSKTIEGLALESGFSNIRTFYNAFKKEKGEIPRIYFQNQALSSED
jgi:YesN/AraC family two-component response regulator